VVFPGAGIPASLLNRGAGEPGVHRNRTRRREVDIALEGRPGGVSVRRSHLDNSSGCHANGSHRKLLSRMLDGRRALNAIEGAIYEVPYAFARDRGYLRDGRVLSIRASRRLCSSGEKRHGRHRAKSSEHGHYQNLCAGKTDGYSDRVRGRCGSLLRISY
jgi:hypothetical protein